MKAKTMSFHNWMNNICLFGIENCVGVNTNPIIVTLHIVSDGIKKN